MPTGTNLLEASREAGAGIEAVCGGARGCGKCKVRIETGYFAKWGITSGPGHVSEWEPDEAFAFAAQCPSSRTSPHRTVSANWNHRSPAFNKS